MCGLVGYIDLSNQRNVEKKILKKMADVITHRGPDSSGFFIEKNTGLGFRRLSIIDLHSGDQPVFNEDRSLVMVCNGEIFNYRELRNELIQKGHRFYTNTDVEVLIHLYEEEGVELLQKLNGQFSFIIFDRKNNKLFIARDHFGITPFYYTRTNGMLVFASEIKAILEHPQVKREVDLTGMDQILSFPGLINPRTAFKGIKALKNGHYIIVQNNTVKIKEYWDLNYPKTGEISYDQPEKYYVEKLDELIRRSVKYRLRADVPLGFYLSGGLDSSLIAGMIKDIRPDKQGRSFSIDFTDNEISESLYQQMVVEHVNSKHSKVLFDWDQIVQRFRKTIYHCECPVKETFNTCTHALSEIAGKDGVKVVLSGEGSDELFAGYISYRFDQRGIREAEKYNLETALEEELRQKIWGNGNIFYEKDQYLFKEIKKELYSAELNEQFDEFDCLNFELVNNDLLKDRHPIHQRSYLDFKLRLTDHLLIEHGDKLAMSNSIEVRYPFLDIELVEFVKQIPPSLKLNNLNEKYILKRIAEKIVPEKVINRKKFGFRSPGSPHILQQNIEWVNDILSYERIKKQGYFNPDVIENLKKQNSKAGVKIHPHLQGDFLLFVLSFGVFLEEFQLPGIGG